MKWETGWDELLSLLVLFIHVYCTRLVTTRSEQDIITRFYIHQIKVQRLEHPQMQKKEHQNWKEQSLFQRYT